SLNLAKLSAGHYFVARLDLHALCSTSRAKSRIVLANNHLRVLASAWLDTGTPFAIRAVLPSFSPSPESPAG
ncbi:MAG: hypothetical protein ACREKM_10520, partial [Longimicrobiales bacterium]